MGVQTLHTVILCMYSVKLYSGTEKVLNGGVSLLRSTAELLSRPTCYCSFAKDTLSVPVCAKCF